MFPLTMLGEPVWQRLTWTLLHFLWQGLAVAAVAAVFIYVWPLRRAHNRYLIYLFALIAMAACPLVTFTVIEVPESAVVVRRETAMQASRPLAPDPGPGFVATETPVGSTGPEVREDQPPLEHSEMAASEMGYPASLPAVATWEAELRQHIDAIQPYAMIAWMAGVLLLGVRLSLSWFRVRWLVWCRRVIPADLAAKAAALGKRLGLRFPPRVCVSDKIREAIVVGLWRPLVLLPVSWLMEMPPEVLEAVIAHELAHVRRLDLWVNLLQRLMETLLFYHPAVWWLSRRVSLEREMCADELAVGATSERFLYATALERLGRMRLGQTAPQLGAAMGDKRMVLLNRVGNILGSSPSNKRARWWPAGLLALAVPLAIWLASTSIASPGANEARAENLSDGAAEIAKLIEQLGGETSAQRAAAEKALEKIGEPASEALWAARDDKNPERAARARATLRQIVESDQRKRIREADEQISALLRQWKQAGKARPAVDANEIPGLIEQLGAPTAAQRSAAQEALAKMGLAATEALAAATKDANPERAARTKAALAQMAIRKEDWPVHWQNVTFLYRSLSPDPYECKAVGVDPELRAVFIWWDPAAKAFAKAEWTVPREEADMLYRSLGQPWVPSESFFEARQADNARVELVITLGDRFARFCEPLPPNNPPPGSRIMSIHTLNKILPLQDMARKQMAIRKQSGGTRPAAAAARGEEENGKAPATPFGDEEALTHARKLLAEARRTGKPLPTGDKQELYASAHTAGAIDAWTAAGKAQDAYEKTYDAVGKKSRPGKADPNTPAARAEFAKVEKLYLDAIERLGVNEYGASAERYLAGAYRYVGRKDKFEQWSKQAKQTELVAAKLKELTRSRREGGDWPELAALMRLLHNPGNVSRDDLAAPLSKLGKRSDEAVAAITEEFWGSGYRTAYRGHVIWALAVMDSPASRKALLKLALDGGHKDDRGLIRSAAREYLKLLPDKAGATCLLAAPDSDVVIQALMHLRGEPIDKEMFDRLMELMRTGDREIRFQVVQNFGQDPAGLFVAEKVAAIVKAIPEIAGMPKADETAWPGNWTNAEVRYRLCTDALSRLTNPPEPIDKALAAAQEGDAVWRCLVLARGLAGEAKARPGLRKVLADAKAGMLRAWACEALGKIGSAEDLPLLRQVAEKDPLKRERGGCLAPMNKDLIYPVREAAQEAIKTLQAAPAVPGASGSAGNGTRAEEVPEDAAPSEEMVPETKEGASWGAAAEGVQVRLRAKQSKWKQGTAARLLADVRNQGKRNLFVRTQFNRCELEVDGRWYRGPLPGGRLLRLQPFPPGRQYDNIGVDLHASWELAASRIVRTPWETELKLTPGKHTIRVAFTAMAATKARAPIYAPGKDVRAVSNSIEIEIVAKSDEKVNATPEGNAGVTAAEPAVEAAAVKPDDRTPPVRPASVSGKVLGADGKPLAGVPLAVKCLDQRRKWAGSRQLQSDERGRFKISDLSAGEIFICYEKGSKNVPERAGDAQMFISHVRVEAGKAVENVLIDLSKATCVVKGRLVDHKGKGIAGASVQALYAPSWVAHVVWTETDEDGRYRIAGLPPHEFRVFAHTMDHYGGPGKQISLKSGKTETIDMLAYIPSRPAPEPKPDDPRWGGPKGDLRAAIELRPSREAYAIGEIVELKPILRNTGEKTMTLVHDFSATSELQVTDEAGKTRTFSYKNFSGRTVSTTYVIQPGHEVPMQASVRLKLVGDDSREDLIQKPGTPLAFAMKCRPGTRYTFSYDLGEGLRTGEVHLAVKDCVAAKNKTP